jgi:ribonuclease HII
MLFRMYAMLQYENKAESQGYLHIAGVDEAGRGPLAGPVVASAVILPANVSLDGLTDSKKLTLKQREHFFPIIKQVAVAYAIETVSSEVIDEINILQASLLAMKQAVDKLSQQADLLLIDGNQRVKTSTDQWTIVKGDSLSLSIAAASVLAKVTRDKLMEDYHTEYPQYEFARHKGYGTKLHRDRINQHGPCPIHRRSFRGVLPEETENISSA